MEKPYLCLLYSLTEIRGAGTIVRWQKVWDILWKLQSDDFIKDIVNDTFTKDEMSHFILYDRAGFEKTKKPKQFSD